METLKNWFSQFLVWVQEVVLTPETLIQVGILVGLGFLSFIGSKIVAKGISRLGNQIKLIKKSENYLKPLHFPILFLILTQLTRLLGQALQQPVGVFIIAGNLLGAWIIIRLMTNFIKNRQIGHFLAILVWIIAALNIVGWLDAIVATLQAASITLGETEVTAYDVIWGFISLILLVWIAVFLSKLVEAQMKTLRGVNPSIRVLVTKVSKILLVTFAFLIALNTVGIDLTALAVFGGALGVGLGFGLQKVVSNFISGVILLLDRSIKPGDVIEIQETYGAINKLAARYTSVITRDGTEFLIPNEDMITQPVINWSHTDKVVRRKLPVNVSYDSDIYRARELMLEAAKENDRVLDEPRPVAHLIGFGDNGVDLELRIWINDPEGGVVNVSSEVLLKVWDKFHEEGIEFPFPQRVVHFAQDQKEEAKKKALSKKRAKSKRK